MFSIISSTTIHLACNVGVFFGPANAIAAILDFKRRGRLRRVERSTEGVGISLKGKVGRREREKKYTLARSHCLFAKLHSWANRVSDWCSVALVD